MNTEYTCPACGTLLTSEDEKCPKCNKVEQPAGTMPDTETAAETAETPPMVGVAQEAAETAPQTLDGTSPKPVMVRCRMFLGILGGKQVTVVHGMLLVIFMMLFISMYNYGCDFFKFLGTKSEAGTIFTVYNGFMAFFCAYTLFSAVIIRPNGLYLMRYYFVLRFFSAIGYLYVCSHTGGGDVFLYAFDILVLFLLLIYLGAYEQPRRVYPTEGRRHYYYDIILFLAICVMQIVYFNNYLHVCRILASYGLTL